VGGQCGINYSASGTYPRWESVEGIFNSKKSSAKAKGPTVYTGDYSLRLLSEATTVGKYEGQGSYSYKWTDSERDENCNKIGAYDECYNITTNTKLAGPVSRYVNSPTSNGIKSERKGETLKMRDSSAELISKNTGNNSCEYTVTGILGRATEILAATGVVPSCAILGLSYTLSRKDGPMGDPFNFKGQVNGVERGTGSL